MEIMKILVLESLNIFEFKMDLKNHYFKFF